MKWFGKIKELLENIKEWLVWFGIPPYRLFEKEEEEPYEEETIEEDFEEKYIEIAEDPKPPLILNVKVSKIEKGKRYSLLPMPEGSKYVAEIEIERPKGYTIFCGASAISEERRKNVPDFMKKALKQGKTTGYMQDPPSHRMSLSNIIHLNNYVRYYKHPITKEDAQNHFLDVAEIRPIGIKIGKNCEKYRRD